MRIPVGGWCFPGLDCPGLIEAISGCYSTRFCFGVFRGLIAPASLKLGSTGQYEFNAGEFSGA